MAITEADIIERVIGPNQASLSPETARSILGLQFDDSAQSRIRVLLRNNADGTISAEDKGELDKYLRVGTFLDLIRAKAKLSLNANEA